MADADPSTPVPAEDADGVVYGLRRLTATPANGGIDVAVAAARRVIGALLHTGDGTQAELYDVARRLDEVADYLESHAPETDVRLIDMWAGEGVSRHDPITGPENAIAPPLTLQGNEDGSISGVVTLGLPYQGQPGHAHGGVSAMLLDHTLGVANAYAGLSGMTGTITFRYERPVPLFVPLTIRGWQERVEGRKIWAAGELSVGETVCVRAQGLFIAKHLPRPR